MLASGRMFQAILGVLVLSALVTEGCHSQYVGGKDTGSTKYKLKARTGVAILFQGLAHAVCLNVCHLAHLHLMTTCVLWLGAGDNIMQTDEPLPQ